MWQNERSLELEMLDLGPSHYSLEEYNACLKLLSRINCILGGFKATLKEFKALNHPIASILEIGCGGGYLCKKLERVFPNAEIKGIDLSSEAIIHAEKLLPSSRISFEVQKEKTLSFPDDSFDVVTTMLVCHHMKDEEVVKFLKDTYRICKKAVIINDLQRHLLAYVSFSLIAPILFPSRLIWNDGRLSIRRAFRKRDWITLLEKAGFHQGQWSLKWNWAFRWTLTLSKM